jgi:hypothetical protein
MQSVTCFHCVHEVKIAPDASLCLVCGEDLQHLLLAETIVGYFQGRAHDLSERSELGAALAEAERGLTYADSSELHLLAAILAKQLGRYDRMRHHVAAIPVDDTLRNEAEWLLRSHQDRERALQAAARQAQTPAPAKLTSAPQPASLAVPVGHARHTPLSPASTFLEELFGVQEPVATRSPRNNGQAVASVAIVVIAVTMVAASWWWIGPGALPDDNNEMSSVEGNGVDGNRVEGNSLAPTGSSPTTAPTLAPATNTDTEVTDAGSTGEATVTPVLESAPILLPTATPTPMIADNLVEAPAQNGELVDANPRRVLLIQPNTMGLQQYLRDQGYPELAELPVESRVEGNMLVLQGIVHLDSQRRELIEIAQTIPGISTINAIDLLVRPMPTYMVQEGDTLWLIVYNIYGNVDRLDEFAAHNFDVLPEPDALAPGIELKVLPFQ